jgi:tetratricopeptide (TPR) repeat protein
MRADDRRYRTLRSWLGWCVVVLLWPQSAWAVSPGQEALDRGAHFYQAGRFEEARSAFQTATELDPGLLKAWENLGWASHRAGKDDDALRIWEILLKIEPDNVSVINEMGAIHFARHSWDRALARYQESLRLSPDQPATLFRLAEIDEARGYRADAARHYHAAELAYLRGLKADPTDADALVDLGWATRKQGKTNEAIAAWKKAIRLDPDSDRLYRHLADASIEIGDAASARTWYEKAWAAGHRNPSIPYRLAELAFEAHDDQRARSWIARIFEFADGDEDWSLRVANLFLRHDRSREGVLFFTQQLKASRRGGHTERALSRLYAFEAGSAYQSDRLDDAIERYRQALALDPEAGNVLRDLGWAYWRTGRWELCEATWKRYREIGPNRPEPHNLLTQLYLAKKAYPAAIRSIHTSLRFSRNQPGEELKLAKALFWDGQFETAKRHALTLAKRYPDDLGVQFFWGEILMQYHEYAAGQRQWRKILDLGSESPKAYAYWLRSRYNLGEYEAALKEAQDLLATRGPEQAILRFLIEDAIIRDDKPEAVRWYELAVQHIPDRPALWLELSLLYRELGLIVQSEHTLEQARARHPVHLEVLSSLADSHRLGKRYDDASRSYAALIERFPRNRRVFIGLLNTLIEAQRFDEALKLLERNRGTFLTDYEVRLHRGRILIADGRTPDAQTLLTRVASPDKGTHYVPILLYHGLGEHPRSANLPITLFDSQMRALRDAGYTAITVRELVEMVDGRRPFPKQAILITFDDARIDSFERGDPILAKYGMNATMFVPTARILDDHPFFADWEMVRRYAKTGRWDLQGHGHHAHDLIPTDEGEQTGGFLVNRQWLDGQERLETHEEYVSRLDADYREGLHRLRRNVSDVQVVGYAFPFSEAGQENVGNEPEAADVNERLVFQHFTYGFVQDQNGYNEVGSSAPMMLRRFNVPRSWNGEKLLKHLAARHPRHIARMEIGKSWYWSGRYEQSRAVFRGLAAETPLLKAESERHLAAVAYRQARYRDAQHHLETALIYGERSGDRERLMDNILWENRPRVAQRAGVFHDSNGRTNWWKTLQFRYPLVRPIDVWADVGLVRFQEEGLRDLSGRELTVGAAWRGANRLAAEARGRGRFMDSSENTANAWVQGSYTSDVHAFSIQWALEDVDTVRAHEAGIRSRAYGAGYLIRPTLAWQSRVQLALLRYTDDNARFDIRAATTHSPRIWPHWRVGGVLTRSDTREQSTRYYTPEELVTGRGILSYRRRWDSGWEVAGEAGLGWATDALRGNRWVSHSLLEALQAWTPRLRSRLGWDHSRSPGYQSWTIEGLLDYRF